MPDDDDDGRTGGSPSFVWILMVLAGVVGGPKMPKMFELAGEGTTGGEPVKDGAGIGGAEAEALVKAGFPGGVIDFLSASSLRAKSVRLTKPGGRLIADGWGRLSKPQSNVDAGFEAGVGVVRCNSGDGGAGDGEVLAPRRTVD